MWDLVAEEEEEVEQRVDTWQEEMHVGCPCIVAICLLEPVVVM